MNKAQQAALDYRLQDIRRHWSENTKEERLLSPTGETTPGSDVAPSSPSTYVGKASDISFVRNISQYMRNPEAPDGDNRLVQNYSQTHVPDCLIALKFPLQVPSRDEAEQFIDVYLSTIHIAYPFICKPIMLEAFQRFQAGDDDKGEFREWLALFSKAGAPYFYIRVLWVVILTTSQIPYLPSDRITRPSLMGRTIVPTNTLDILNSPSTSRVKSARIAL